MRSQRGWTQYSSWARRLTRQAVTRSSALPRESRSKLPPNSSSFSSEQPCSPTWSSESKKSACCSPTEEIAGIGSRADSVGVAADLNRNKGGNKHGTADDSKYITET